MSINFQELMKSAETSDFALIPDGTYDVVCEKAESTTSSNGKPMIKVVFVVANGPHAKRKLFNQYVISADNANALNFFFQHMAAFGLDKGYFAQNPNLDLVAQTMVGKTVQVEVGHKTWQGQDRNDVKSTKPPTGGVQPVIGVPSPVAPVPSSTPGVPSIPQPTVNPAASSEELF